MESAHAEAAIMLIEAGADRTRVRPVPSQRCPYLFVPNRAMTISNVGKSGERDPGASNRCRGTGAKACYRVCCLALRSTNVTLVRVQRSLPIVSIPSRYVCFSAHRYRRHIH